MAGRFGTATKATWRWLARTSPSEAGHWRSSGFLTWLVWAALHVLALPQLQNRFRVQTQWF
ncbi:NADH dehydrogenase FAD-containing subunit [Bradyrhizobium sp. AZCC 2289]